MWETKLISGFLWLYWVFVNLKSAPCRRRPQVLPNGWCLSTNLKGTHSRIFHMNLCSPYHRPPLDPMQMHPKYVLHFGFILILSTNLYLYFRSDRLCKQYDTFLTCNSGYRSLPTQLLNTSTYIAVVMFRVGVRWKEKAVTASFLPLPWTWWLQCKPKYCNSFSIWRS
jgi:hypothetical protein